MEVVVVVDHMSSRGPGSPTCRLASLALLAVDDLAFLRANGKLGPSRDQT